MQPHRQAGCAGQDQDGCDDQRRSMMFQGFTCISANI
jgi:hypothetical protein